MKYLEDYCLSNNLPIPKIAVAREGDILTKGAQARADAAKWTIFVQPWHTKPSDYMLAHEMAHLLVHKDGEREDSISHGKRMAQKQLEIERFFAQKRREERRKK